MGAARRWRVRAGLLVLALAFASAGCHRAVRPVTGEAEPPPVPVDGGAFTVAESMLDTWNTIGQVLVGLDGVGYEGRAQMLGLYMVRYRGEHFLLRTRALPITSAEQGLRTRVDALDAKGRPFQGPAAVALLQVLAQRVPMEVERFRQPVRLPPGD